ncbi:S-adenosyl-L-methionine-dependent methyltransferase [Dacryopinax primogenitus]|uniref:S-adenosyl-L-methionine-dependent methyltransferase n=1 Tax=Dacryopinax primogenitus (strain DJM 731) TaxID=1858805 RepID=M5G1G1_DACPD|nr:S-adenosyl-L-methionine-dependent methyltransferase [Dacryopinax primogenitus]EJT97597.1 S-adenosyl-L-methionine-dependent methyltransferase [Dacryopinax primogenitus]
MPASSPRPPPAAAPVAYTPGTVVARSYTSEMSAPPISAGVQRLREIMKENGEEAGWDKAWQEDVTPWETHDRTTDGVRPLLKEVLDSGEFPVPKEGRALVPGCGRGFDAVFIARLGLETWGIDLSTRAVERAEAFLNSQLDAPPNVHFQTADFLTFPIPQDGFTLAYDYTFFCAIPPPLRNPWGKRMTELVHPGGYLVAVAWPLDGEREGGPPYSVSVDAYEEALGVGRGLWTKVVDRPSELSADGVHKGRERVVVWKREGGARM